jgi:hypothetical protein
MEERMLKLAKKETLSTAAKVDPVDPKLRTKHARLVARAAELREEITRTEREGEALAVAVERARRHAADGSGDFPALVEAEAKLAANVTIRSAADSVLAEVEAEGATVEAEILAAERAVDVARQREAAAPLQAEAERLAEAFAEALLSLTEPLVKRGQIAAKLTRDFPNAMPVPPLSLDVIADRLRAAREYHEYGAALACRAWLLRLLHGPVVRTQDSELFRHLHVR